MKIIKVMLVLILVVIGINYYAINKIVVNEYVFDSPKVDEEVTFLQITDLHGKIFNNDQQYLINMINKQDFDYLLFTGDALDYSDEEDLKSVELLLKGVNKPMYFIYGNHDIESINYDKYAKLLVDYNVKIIENKCEFLNNDIKICGVYDENKDHLKKPFPVSETLNNDDFNVLLAHQPQSFKKYASDGVDLMFSGHTHGGQLRLPFIGAIVAPDQGLLPYYDEGEFIEGDSRLMISSGLGTTIIPVRTFNQPELIVYKVQ